MVTIMKGVIFLVMVTIAKVVVVFVLMVTIICTILRRGTMSIILARKEHSQYEKETCRACLRWLLVKHFGG